MPTWIKRILVIASIPFFIALAMLCVKAYDEDLYDQIMRTAKSFRIVRLDSKTSHLEYSNAEVDPVAYVNSNYDEAKISSSVKIDLHKVGTQKIKFKVTLDENSNEQDVEFIVKDTKAPSIVLAKEAFTIEYGDSFDPREVVASVADEVDGELEYVETPPTSTAQNVGLETFYEKGWYSLEGSVNSSASGSYSLRIKAMDKHGNASIKNLDVTVAEPAQNNPAPVQAPQAMTLTYVVNESTRKFHKPNCSSVWRINEENRAEITASRDDLIKDGYQPCGKCRP